jgi:hypothetical protein
MIPILLNSVCLLFSLLCITGVIFNFSKYHALRKEKRLEQKEFQQLDASVKHLRIVHSAAHN